MKKTVSVLLAVLTLLCHTAAAEEAPAEPLRDLAEPYGFRMGAPLSYMQLMDQTYLSILKEHFNSITATNEMKAYSLLDEKASKARTDGRPPRNYGGADQMAHFAADNGIAMRGHGWV